MIDTGKVIGLIKSLGSQDPGGSGSGFVVPTYTSESTILPDGSSPIGVTATCDMSVSEIADAINNNRCLFCKITDGSFSTYLMVSDFYTIEDNGKTEYNIVYERTCSGFGASSDGLYATNYFLMHSTYNQNESVACYIIPCTIPFMTGGY